MSLSRRDKSELAAAIDEAQFRLELFGQPAFQAMLDRLVDDPDEVRLAADDPMLYLTKQGVTLPKDVSVSMLVDQPSSRSVRAKGKWFIGFCREKDGGSACCSGYSSNQGWIWRYGDGCKNQPSGAT